MRTLSISVCVNPPARVWPPITPSQAFDSAWYRFEPVPTTISQRSMRP